MGKSKLGPDFWGPIGLAGIEPAAEPANVAIGAEPAELPPCVPKCFTFFGNCFTFQIPGGMLNLTCC